MVLNDNRGAIALLTILIVGGAVLAMSLGAAIVAFDELDGGDFLIKGEKALSITEGCVDEGALMLRANSGLTNASFSLGGGTCEVEVFDNSEKYIINATSTLDGYSKRVIREINKF